MPKKNILITGGAGFIGSHVAEHYLKNGDRVWAVDNLDTGRLSNISAFQSDENFRFTEADICNWIQIEEAVEWSDRIIHLAATIGQFKVLANPTLTLSNNIGGCEKLLQAMGKTKKETRILIASTSEAYSHSDPLPDGSFREDAMIKMPSGHVIQTAYPVGKVVNELMGLAYVQEKDLFCTIVRIFNTIGTRQQSFYGMVVPTFICQALNQQPITVYGDGSQTRSFANAHDVVNQFDLLIESPKSKGEIVNVGNNRECSIMDLAKLVIKITKSNSQIRLVPYKEAYGFDFVDPMRRKPCLEKINELVGLKCVWTLEQTLEEIRDYILGKGKSSEGLYTP